MADPYHVAHVKLTSASDTATLQAWIDANYPCTIVEIMPNGLDLLILYT
jgi:hypothetical protein